MIIVGGTYDGKKIILDKIPEGVPADTPVKVLLQTSEQRTGLDAIIGIAKDTELPPDFAAQHEHYTKGTPKR